MLSRRLTLTHILDILDNALILFKLLITPHFFDHLATVEAQTTTVITLRRLVDQSRLNSFDQLQ